MSLQSRSLQFQYSAEDQFSFPDLDISRGESALLLGPSGSGKTTLLHLLAGLQSPSSGSVQVADQELFALKPARRDAWRGQHIGIVFQKSYFLPYLSIGENLALASSLNGPAPGTRVIRSALEKLGLENLYAKKPANCSIGEQQRASIARALLQRPSLILADEPTSALDDANAEKVASLLRQLAEEQNAALLIVTHDARLKAHFSKTYQL